MIKHASKVAVAFAAFAAVALTSCGGNGDDQTEGSAADATTPTSALAAPVTSDVAGAEPTVAGSRVVTSTSDQVDLTLLAIGDSIPFNLDADCPGCTGYVDQYGQSLEAATGRGVSVVNLSRHTGLTSEGLLQDLENEQFRESVADADAITVSIGFNDAPMSVSDDPCDGADSDSPAFPDLASYTDACIDEWADAFALRFETILDEIEDLRDGKPTLLTVVNIYDWWLGFADNPAEFDADITVVRTVLERQNADICRIAAEHDALCADLHTAFNGATHDRPSGTLLAADYSHPSQAGNDLIAETLTQLGYAPLV